MSPINKLFFISVLSVLVAPCDGRTVFQNVEFTQHDAVRVVDQSNQLVFDWQSDKPLIPASLVKLATAHLAIAKWGLGHHFVTDFYRVGDSLWVKGYGDPFVVSEELDVIVMKLRELGITQVESIYIDSSYFELATVPGRSRVTDPYNAPLSAVSANFNTAILQRVDGRVVSAEPQTPLTQTANKLAHLVGERVERVNLVDQDRAQTHFAELLSLKAGWDEPKVYINQRLPESARPIYRHTNSKSLADMLQGMLEFSNNFIANHIFLKLAEDNGPPLNFGAARQAANNRLLHQFDWAKFLLVDGAGLARDNRLSARQIDDLLRELHQNKTLLKQYEIPGSTAVVHAKTGTLDGVQSYAGYIEFPNRTYRFVFNLNRDAPYRYRDHLLKVLVTQLTKQTVFE